MRCGTTGLLAGRAACGDAVAGVAAAGGRAACSRYPQTPQNRAVGSNGELHEGQFIPGKFSQRNRGFASLFPTFSTSTASGES